MLREALSTKKNLERSFEDAGLHLVVEAIY